MHYSHKNVFRLIRTNLGSYSRAGFYFIENLKKKNWLLFGNQVRMAVFIPSLYLVHLYCKLYHLRVIKRLAFCIIISQQ